jgi:hypothetical protein
MERERVTISPREKAHRNEVANAANHVKELNGALILFENSNYDLTTEDADFIFETIGEDILNRVGIAHILHGMEMDGDGTGVRMHEISYDKYDESCVLLYREVIKQCVIHRYYPASVTFEDVQRSLYEEYELNTTGMTPKNVPQIH